MRDVRVAKLRLNRDTRIRTLLPSGRSGRFLAAIVAAITLGFLSLSFVVDGAWSQFFGIWVAVPTHVVVCALAIRLARRCGGSLGRFWLAFAIACSVALMSVVTTSLALWVGLPVAGIVSAIAVPVTAGLVIWSIWLRPQTLRGRSGTLGFFNVLVVLSVVSAYASFFFVVPAYQSSPVNGLLWVWITFLSIILCSIGILILSRSSDSDALQTETMYALMLCLSMAWMLFLTLAAAARGVDVVEALPPALNGLLWLSVWVCGIAMAYAESADQPKPTGVRIADEPLIRSVWPYAVLALMPPLAFGAVFVDDISRKLTAVLGFIFVFVVVLVRQFVLIAERRADGGRQRELQMSARLERERMDALVEVGLDLSSADTREDMCRVVAERLDTALEEAHGTIVVLNDPSAHPLQIAAANGVELTTTPARAWTLVHRPGDATAPLGRAVVKALTANPAARLAWTSAIVTSDGVKIGMMIAVGPAFWTISDEEADVMSGFADQLSVALERVALLDGIRARGARVRSLVENLREGVALLDMDGRVLAANSAFAELMSVSADALNGRRLADALPEDDERRSAFAPPLSPQTGQAVVDVTTTHARAYEFSIAFLEHELVGGGGREALAVVREVTGFREREQRITSLLHELELRDRATAELLDRVISAAEDERQRLASELNAGPVEDLSILGMRLDAVRARVGDVRRADAPETSDLLARVRVDVASVVERLRDMIRELRPPALDERGVGPALETLCRRIEADAALSIDVDLRRIPNLPEPAETVLYRVGQELVMNAVRHAEASRISVSLQHDGDDVALEVVDDGVGTVPVNAELLADLTASGRFGIATMTERLDLAGGSLTVDARSNGGTTARATIPTEWEPVP